MRHDRLKYDRYFNLLREIIGDTIVSPDGTKVIHVTVEATTAIVEGADVWDMSGERAAVPANVPYNGFAGSGENSGRFGAFEVYMISDLPAVTSVPRVAGLFSKLWTRRWPNVQNIAAKCKALLQPAFQQWADDEELQAKMLDLTERQQADELLDEYGGRASAFMLTALVTRQQRLDEADTALNDALKAGEPFCCVGGELGDSIAKLKHVIEEQQAHASPSVKGKALATLDHWIATHALSSCSQAVQSHASRDVMDALKASIEAARALTPRCGGRGGGAAASKGGGCCSARRSGSSNGGGTDQRYN